MKHADLAAVQEAFSAQAPVFDRLDAEEPLIGWVRDAVRDELLRILRPGSRLLEINAGTGLDAAFLASAGVHVTASENAPGMLALLRARAPHAPGFDVLDLDYHRLHTLPASSYDHVFSGFGGLNCTDRLGTVLRGIDRVLKPGGHCALVIMPRHSPWEWIELLRGNTSFAMRRYRKGGVPARVEGRVFQCHYHDVGSVRRALPQYTTVSLMALSLAVPPPHLGPFARRHPVLLSGLKRVERVIREWPLLRRCGDHCLIILRKPV